MNHESWLGALDREGHAFGAAAEHAGLTAEVSSCPGWTVTDLLTHLGRVHRWVTDIVGRSGTEPFPYTDREPDANPKAVTPGTATGRWRERGRIGPKLTKSRRGPVWPKACRLAMMISSRSPGVIKSTPRLK